LFIPVKICRDKLYNDKLLNKKIKNIKGGMKMEERKSKLVAGLLGIFLGYLGIHNFYLGYTKKAIIQVSVYVGCMIVGSILLIIGIGIFFYMGAIGISIWALVEGIMILAGAINVDGKGIPLKE